MFYLFDLKEIRVRQFGPVSLFSFVLQWYNDIEMKACPKRYVMFSPQKERAPSAPRFFTFFTIYIATTFLYCGHRFWAHLYFSQFGEYAPYYFKVTEIS